MELLTCVCCELCCECYTAVPMKRVQHFFHDRIFEINDPVEVVEIIGAKSSSSNKRFIFSRSDIEPELCALRFGEIIAEDADVFTRDRCLYATHVPVRWNDEYGAFGRELGAIFCKLCSVSDEVEFGLGHWWMFEYKLRCMYSVFEDAMQDGLGKEKCHDFVDVDRTGFCSLEDGLDLGKTENRSRENDGRDRSDFFWYFTRPLEHRSYDPMHDLLPKRDINQLPRGDACTEGFWDKIREPLTVVRCVEREDLSDHGSIVSR